MVREVVQALVSLKRYLARLENWIIIELPIKLPRFLECWW